MLKANGWNFINFSDIFKSSNASLMPDLCGLHKFKSNPVFIYIQPRKVKPRLVSFQQR